MAQFLVYIYDEESHKEEVFQVEADSEFEVYSKFFGVIEVERISEYYEEESF